MKSADTVRRALDLRAEGRTQRAIADELGVSTSSVGRWIGQGSSALTDPRAIAYGEMCPARCPARRTTDCAEYAYLLGQYLGDGWIGSKTRTKQLVISCCAAYPGIIDECTAALQAVMPGHAIRHRPRTGVVAVHCDSRHWPCLFPQHGPGRKHERPIALEPWQRKVALDDHPGPFARGLIHSDGWRGVNRGRGSNGTVYEYTRYQFCNVSEDIQRLFVEACDRLGVETKQMNRRNLAVNKRAAVARLDEFVGPKY